MSRQFRFVVVAVFFLPLQRALERPVYDGQDHRGNEQNVFTN